MTQQTSGAKQTQEEMSAIREVFAYARTRQTHEAVLYAVEVGHALVDDKPVPVAPLTVDILSAQKIVADIKRLVAGEEVLS